MGNTKTERKSKSTVKVDKLIIICSIHIFVNFATHLYRPKLTLWGFPFLTNSKCLMNFSVTVLYFTGMRNVQTNRLRKLVKLSR